MIPLLSVLIGLPLLAALACLAWPRRARALALVTALMLVVLGAWSAMHFSSSTRAMQLEERAGIVYLGSLDVSYHVGVDGISYPLVLLTIVLVLVAVLISRREITHDEGGYYAILLGLAGVVIGVFASLNLILFFVFWEVVLVLMFLLILRWGLENRKYAAMRFLIYTGLGSAGLLLAIIFIAAFAGTVDVTRIDVGRIAPTMQWVLVGLLLFGFFIKMPIVPFHSWLPDAHVQAPTAGSVLLAGVLLKMGAYGLVRVGLGVFGAVFALLAPWLFALGVITILYAALVCLAQTNMKRLIAYSSVSHMGLVLVAIATGTALSLSGAVLQMVSHGLIAALLFALAGLVHERAGTFDLDALRGLATRMPRTAWLLVLGALASLGVPAMIGFIAEFSILLGAFERFSYATLLPLLGIILSGAYVTRLLARGVFGAPATRPRAYDEQGVSMLPFGILTLLIILLGLAPSLLTTIIAASAMT